MATEDGLERLRSDALERVSDGVVALDADLRYTYVNRAAERLLGTERGDLLGEHVWDAFPEAEGTAAQDAIEGAMATQERRTFERYNPERDRWFEVRVYPGEDGVSVYFTDVTEREESERELERTSRLLGALAENTSEAVYAKDPDGAYRLVNEGAARLFGLDPEEVVGKTDDDLFDPESAARSRASDERILQRGEAERYEAVRYIDGEEHVFLVAKCPYRDDAGEIAGLVGISREIADRKRRERELRELTEEYETILDNVEDAVFLLDVVEGDDGDVEFRYERLDSTHEATVGIRTEDVRGLTPREALGPEVGAEVAANYRRCYRRREPISYHEELDLPGGEFVWQTKVAPVVVDGEVTRIAGIARDVTDRVEREQELRRKNERLDEFASVISHDLRNPLGVAKGRVALLREEFDSDHLAETAWALDRMEAIVEDTLTLARQGDTVAEAETVAIHDLIGRSWGTVDTAGATLEVADEFAIRGDPDRLRHVFENLFRNAVEHGGDVVRVGLGGEDGFYVADDGPGIPPERREAVFEVGETSTTDGTGFGLTIVNRIAEAHGWTVSVTGGADGGARFEFDGVDVVPGD